MLVRFLCVLTFVLTSALLTAQDDDYVFSLSEAEGTPGSVIEVKALLDTTAGDDLVGVVFAICHDSDVLDLPTDGLTGLDGEDWDTTFCSRNVLGDDGWLSSYLMNVVSAAVIDPGEYEVALAEYTILDDAEGGTTTTIEYCTLGTPPASASLVPAATVDPVVPVTEEVEIAILAPTPFLRGDCDDNGEVTILDPIYILEGLFLNGPLSDCTAACDANELDGMTIIDAIYLLEYLFLNGVAPEEPFEDGCGTLSGQQIEDCEQQASCE